MRRLAAALAAALLLASGCSSAVDEAAVTEPTVDEPTDPDAGDGPRPDGGQPPADSEQAAPRTGAVELGPRAPCDATYSATEVGSRDFAFDGTITSIVGDVVTFEPREWFVGERDLRATTSVGMAPPTDPGPSETGPAYGVGDRLLVSGDDRIAWGCGFTRYYDTGTARAWRNSS